MLNNPSVPGMSSQKEDRGELFESFLWNDRAAFGGLAQGVDFGNLIEPQRLSRPLGEGDTLVVAVMHGDEYGGRKRHDARAAQAIRRSDNSISAVCSPS